MAQNKKTRTRILCYFTILAILFSCSQSSRYKWASFFFDGVPNPDEEKQVEVQADTTKIVRTFKRVQPKLFLHDPYREKSCDVCHEGARSHRLLDRQPGLCYQCHEDFAENYAVIHGPTAGGFCTMCHNPHMTKIEKLLKRSGKQLCLFCHEKGLVLKNEVHEEIEDTNCTECHNPHGGEDQFLLN